MNIQETEVLNWLASQEQNMLDLTAELVNIDSGTYNKPGVDAVGDVIQGFLESSGVPCEVIALERSGDALRATVTGPPGNRPILLLGHRDTVFPEGEASRRPFSIIDGHAMGPGVADMKFGVVVNAFLLAAFTRFNSASAPLVGLFTGDEEIGSPQSRPLIEAEGRRASAVFNTEPTSPGSGLVYGRKGGVFFHCEVLGEPAHSGANFEDGISAIEEIARKTQAWHALTALDRGITLNVGLIRGGQSVNTVAPTADCRIDLRYTQPDERDELVSRVTAIGQSCSVAGARSTIKITGEFLPLAQTPASRALLNAYVASARELGIDAIGRFSGGCTDSGFTAGVGAPTLCGLGAVGGKHHSPEEFMEVSAVIPRIQTLALTIMRLRSELGIATH